MLSDCERAPRDAEPVSGPGPVLCAVRQAGESHQAASQSGMPYPVAVVSDGSALTPRDPPAGLDPSNLSYATRRRHRAGEASDRWSPMRR